MSDCCQKLEVDSVEWHSVDPEARMKYVERFRRYRPTLDDQFDKLKSTGRKPSDRKRTRKPDLECAFDQQDKKEKESRKSLTFQNPNALEKISYELFFHSMVPRLVNRCKGNCGGKLFPADKEDYLVVKSRGRITFMNKQGEMNSKLCPLYIHFKVECRKEYARRIHDLHYEAFPYSEIAFGKGTLTRLPEEVKVFLENLVWMCQIIKSKVFYITFS